jgi:hypothetical protein
MVDEAAAMDASDVHPGRYPKRDRHPPTVWYKVQRARVNAARGLTDSPQSFKEVQARPDYELFKEALDVEMAALWEKGVYEECSLPPGMKALPTKVVWQIKRDQLGNVDKYKCRLVAKGYKQIAGRDYDEVFAPTAQQASFRIMVALAAADGLIMDQIDVKTAFLNGDLAEEVYLRLPQELGGRVWRLHKALYGLKQAARAWYEKLSTTMEALQFKASPHDPCLFSSGTDLSRVYVLIHVDDALIVGHREFVTAAKKKIAAQFDIKDMGSAKYFLGIEIIRSSDGSISISQAKYAKDVLERFSMENCKPQVTPLETGLNLSKVDGAAISDGTLYMEVLGSLMYLACHTRPDLCHSVSMLARFMSQPTDVHWQAAKRILRYLKGTVEKCITYVSTPNQGVHSVVTFSDANFAADPDKRRSTSGTVVTFNGRAILWFSKLQSVVATSTAEAEYIAGATATKEGLWVRKMLGEISGAVQPIDLRVDNQSAIKLITQNTAGQSGRTKHVDVQYHFIKERFQRGDLTVDFVKTQDQMADMMTKQLPGPAFKMATGIIMGCV